MFRHARTLVWISSVALLMQGGVIRSEESSSRQTDGDAVIAPTPVTDAQITGWVSDLASDRFRTRRLAMRGLLKAGSRAVAAVAAAADADDLELASRCIDILKTLHQSDNPAAKGVAEEALKRLSKSERASVAQRAAEAVKKPEPIVQNRRRNGVRIQFRVGPAGGIQIARPRRALQRETQVEEDGKKISIKETLGREIVVKVTEKVDGKEKTTEYKAKNAVELKKKHAEIHKLYEKHMRGRGAPRFQPVVVGQAAAIAGQNVAIRQTNNNGMRETDVKIDGKQIHISDAQGKNIVVKVTEKVNGKEKTTESKAKNLDELKKKYPEAAKLYEKYAAGKNNALGGGIFQGNIQINAAGGQVLPFQIPGIQIGGRNAAQQAAARKQIEAAQARLKQATEQLKKLAEGGNVKPDELTKTAKEIESAIKQLQSATKQLAP